jgi:ElaB/YqjD/DUF883 family membrane-anchored ribosome-binding protein
MTQRPNGDNLSQPPATQGSTHARDEVSNATAAISERAQALAADVKRAAGDVAGRARDTAEKQLEGGKDRVGQTLGQLAEALRKTASHLRSGDKTGLTEYVARAADRVESASDYFEERTLGQVVADIEQFARREPAVFLGGAFGAGLLAGRFLRSTRKPPHTKTSGGS